MRPHPKAKGNPYQRELFVRRVLEEGWSVAEASDAAGWSERTGFKWLGRFREEGEAGLADRRSGPRAARNRTPRRKVEKVLRLRRQKRTAWEIAQRLRMPWSTVSGILRREGLGKLKLLEPKQPVRRYERSINGELVHVTIVDESLKLQPYASATQSASRVVSGQVPAISPSSALPRASPGGCPL